MLPVNNSLHQVGKWLIRFAKECTRPVPASKVLPMFQNWLNLVDLICCLGFLGNSWSVPDEIPEDLSYSIPLSTAKHQAFH